jgi:hypothetical protein
MGSTIVPFDFDPQILKLAFTGDYVPVGNPSQIVLTIFEALCGQCDLMPHCRLLM